MPKLEQKNLTFTITLTTKELEILQVALNGEFYESNGKFRCSIAEKLDDFISNLRIYELQVDGIAYAGDRPIG